MGRPLTQINGVLIACGGCHACTMTSNGSSGKFVHSCGLERRCSLREYVHGIAVPLGISNEPMSVPTPLTAAERVAKRELRKRWLEHAESVGIGRAKKGNPRQPSRRVPPSDEMGSDESFSPSESAEVEPQQDAVQGGEGEQQQKDDSPAESDDEPDVPQPAARPRDARTGRFGPARDTTDPELLGSRYRVGA